LRKPCALPVGGTIGLVAPASAPADESIYQSAIDNLTRLGYRVLEGPHLRKVDGFLAGGDKGRVADLHRFLRMKRVDALWCLRGGYGTARLLPFLDTALVRAAQKLLIGFSDITALQCGFLAAGCGSIHGPTAASLLRDGEVSEYSRRHVVAAIQQDRMQRSIIAEYPHAETVEVVRKGEVRGRLVGGNLAVLCSLLGTKWMPTLRNRILFLEDIGEPSYKLDRLLVQLSQSGALSGVLGVAVGLMHDCGPGRRQQATGNPGWRDIVEQHLAPLRVPLVVGLPFGHVTWNAALPVGGYAVLDARRGDLIIEGV
jgi:muramoyltetrapeptide carboxypeptidase